MGIFIAALLVGIIFIIIMEDISGLIVGAIALLLLVLISLGLSATPVETGKENIFALKDNSQSSGSFFLGSGTINEEQYFFYIVETEKGKYFKKAEAKNSFIKEEDGLVQPYMVTYEYRFDSKFARFMYGEYNGDIEYQFVVPRDTVTTDFVVDLE